MWNVNPLILDNDEKGKMFYINYVECKFKYYLISYCCTVGFILTMWNVNLLPRLYVREFGTRFYINYVECKSVRFKIQCITRSCFILTMWNVNVEFKSFNEAKIEGFILTMWNVNFTYFLIYYYIKFVLY